MTVESWPHWLRWMAAVPAALLMGGVVRLFFAFLAWSTSDRTSFFEGGIPYLLASSEIGKHVLSFGVEGFATYWTFAAFMHVIPSHHKTASTAFVSVALCLSLLALVFRLLVAGESEDIAAVAGGIIGYCAFYFGDQHR